VIRLSRFGCCLCVVCSNPLVARSL
jgi:hypothetical protein